MSLLASRAVFRHSKWAGRTTRRFESMTSKVSETAKQTASKAPQAAIEYKSKASEGLSRVTSAARPAIALAARGVGNALGRIGGPVGKLIVFVEKQIPVGIYYSRVGLELSKLVFQGQKMTPPPLSTFQFYFQYVLKTLRNPSSFFTRTSKEVGDSNISSILNRVRNINAAQLAASGVIFAEVLGFFTIGEMIGRMKIVGYRGEKREHH